MRIYIQAFYVKGDTVIVPWNGDDSISIIKIVFNILKQGDKTKYVRTETCQTIHTGGRE